LTLLVLVVKSLWLSAWLTRCWKQLKVKVQPLRSVDIASGWVFAGFDFRVPVAGELARYFAGDFASRILGGRAAGGGCRQFFHRNVHPSPDSRRYSYGVSSGFGFGLARSDSSCFTVFEGLSASSPAVKLIVFTG